MNGGKHDSRSDEQRRAEDVVLDALQKRPDFDSRFERRKPLKLGDSTVYVDGYLSEPETLVEVYAHVGRLKGGQFGKVARDALKLLALQHHAHPDARLMLAFVSKEAVPRRKTWLHNAIVRAGIECVSVDVSADVIAELQNAQKRQGERMRGGEDELSGDDVNEGENA